MRKEQEFLKGMWLKVEILEREELEKARVKELNRRFTIKAISISTLTILFFLLGISYSKFIADVIYPLAFGLLFVTFIFESLSTNRLEENI